MTKTELIKDMKEHVHAGFITRQQLAGFMGKKDPHRVDKYLRDIQPVSGKDYFIRDVADQIMRIGLG